MSIQGQEETLQVAVLEGHQYQDFGNPKVDLNLAFKSCMSIAKSVIGEKTNQELQKHLSRILKDHETGLREAETTFAGQTVKLIQRRAETHNKRMTASGSWASLQRLFLSVLSGVYDLRIGHRVSVYQKEKHFKKVTKSYKITIQQAVSPHREWYNIYIPTINTGIVQKELLLPQEAYKKYSITEQFIKYLSDTEKITIYKTGNVTYLRKSELENALFFHEGR